MKLPILTFTVTLVGLWLCARLGSSVRTRTQSTGDDQEPDFSVALTAALTLLGLLIGFSFSMAVNRYDQRKQYEQEEANAIGTEYLRADLLPSTQAPAVRELLKTYLDQRVLYYETIDERQLAQIDAATARIQGDLWSQVRSAAGVAPTPLIALTVAGMNDVLNAEGYTRAWWRNRVPRAAWALMAAIASFCNVLIGYRACRAGWTLAILPLALSISFLLIADLDSPRGGLIRVAPQNLLSLSQSLQRAR